jgi:hypothetical protein
MEPVGFLVFGLIFLGAALAILVDVELAGKFVGA